MTEPKTVTPEMIAAAWSAWKSRHGEKLGPGPAFREAIQAALAAAPPVEQQPVAWTSAKQLQEVKEIHGVLALMWKKGAVDPMEEIPLYTTPPAPEPVAAHPDDIAVDRFASAMKAKLAQKRAEGYGGWDNPDECSVAWLSHLLVKHIDKGDPVDIGNFAMMIHQRGGEIANDSERYVAKKLHAMPPEKRAQWIRDRTPAKDLKDGELTFELARVGSVIKEGFGDHGGSPGERWYERRDELMAEQSRREAAMEAGGGNV